MSYRPYLAELLGTFTLALVVWLSVAFQMPFSTPVMAALTLGLFVYTVGGISGAHLNPAVTLGMLSIHTIKTNDAIFYIISQFLGAALALILGTLLTGEIASVPTDSSMMVGVSEAIGTFFLAFAVAAATRQKIDPAVSGIVVGGSLFIGIYMAFPFGNAVLNPAVALGIGSFSSMYILGPVVGAVAGAWALDKLYGPTSKKK